MKKLIFIILSMCVAISSFATDVDGYIINKDGDTLKGKVDLRMRGTEIDYDALTFEVEFASPGEKTKKFDHKSDIKGFGFTYLNREFNYIRWEPKKAKQQYPTVEDSFAPNYKYFILRVADGTVPLYYLLQKESSPVPAKGPKQFNPWATGKENAEQTSGHRGNYRKNVGGVQLICDLVLLHPQHGLIYIPHSLGDKQWSKLNKELGIEDGFSSVKQPGWEVTALEDYYKTYSQWKK